MTATISPGGGYAAAPVLGTKPDTREMNLQFAPLIRAVRDNFSRLTADGEKLFKTEPTVDLYDVFVAYLRPSDRHEHDCRCCRDFVGRYGGLVTIDESGVTQSALWPRQIVGSAAGYLDALAAVRTTVERSPVTGVFVCDEAGIGTDRAGGYDHFSVTLPSQARNESITKKAHEVMAQRVQDFGTLSQGLADYPIDLVERVVGLLRADALYRGEKILGAAEFLLNLHKARSGLGRMQPVATNLIWRALASAPPSYVTPRSSVISTILNDLKAGMSINDASRRFAAVMQPDKLMRPQVAPSAGNVAAAEKLFSRLGLASALGRRMARVEEVDALWRPRPVREPAQPSGPIFGGLKTKTRAPGQGVLSEVVGGPVTLARFRSRILPDAVLIEALVPIHGPFIGITTALDPSAEPILQWDEHGRRNPFADYTHKGGSPASAWSLDFPARSRWVPVDAVVLRPHAWFGGEGRFPHQGVGVHALLRGARSRVSPGLALFPENIRSELHEVRSTIEQYSQSSKLQGLDEGSACGITLVGSGVQLRVSTATTRATYVIDRLD